MYVIALGNQLAIIKIHKFRESAPGIEVAQEKLWNKGSKWKNLIEKLNYAL